MSAPPMEQVCAALEKIIRPIVEGQIRGFLKEHPSIIDAVDWYKPAKTREAKAKTLVGSLSKRIVRDLTCGSSAARLEAALLAFDPDAPPISTVARLSAAKPARLECKLSEREPYRLRKSRVMRAPGLAA